MIAGLDESAREEFWKGLSSKSSKKRKSENKKKLRSWQHCRRMWNFNQTAGGGKSYWTNPKARSEGKGRV